MHRRIQPYERSFAAALSASSFLVCVTTVIVMGGVAVWTAPRADSRYSEYDEIPEASLCLRASRKADSVSVFLPMGTPPLRQQLLLRFEKRYQTESMRVFSGSLMKSSTLSCDVSVCTDTALVQDEGPTSRQRPHVVAFELSSLYTIESLYASSLQLDGELYLNANKTYYLSSTHVCWHDSAFTTGPRATGSLQVEFDTLGAMVSNSARLAASSFSGAPAAKQCVDEDAEVGVLPVASVLEQNWLSLSRSYDYDVQRLEERREVVEVASNCSGALARARDVYELDCLLSSSGVCRDSPSLPFRRAADARMRIDVGDDTALIFAETTPSLSHLASLMPIGRSLLFAVMRMCILLVTSAVVYIRSHENTSSPLRTFLSALDTTESDEHPVRGHHTWGGVVTDMAIGGAALAARAIVLIFAWEGLASDGQLLVCLSEVCGAATSTSHFVMRYCILQWQLDRESPLTKLGGPMSAVDSTLSVLVSFSKPPLLLDLSGRFDAIARMLITLLIVTVVFPKAFFSSCSCALLSVTMATSGGNTSYGAVLGVSCLLWVVQATTAAIALSRLFVFPFAFSLARESMLFTPVESALVLFLASFLCSLPTVTRVASRIAQTCNKNV